MKKFTKMFIMASVAANVVLGAMVASGSNGLEAIDAWLNHNITMTFNDKEFKPAEADGTVRVPITYADRTYVPARFVAEKIGAEVGWDEATQTVSIKAKYNAMTGEPLEAPNDSEVQPTVKPAEEKPSEDSTFPIITADNIFSEEIYKETLIDGVTIDYEFSKNLGVFDENGKIALRKTPMSSGDVVAPQAHMVLDIESKDVADAYVDRFISELKAQGFEVIRDENEEFNYLSNTTLAKGFLHASISAAYKRSPWHDEPITIEFFLKSEPKSE